MNIITQTLANIGRVIERKLSLSLLNLSHNAGKYGWDSPREIKR